MTSTTQQTIDMDALHVTNPVLHSLVSIITDNAVSKVHGAEEPRAHRSLMAELQQNIGYSFQISTRNLPRPLKVAAIVRYLKDILHSMIAQRTLLDVLIALEEISANIIEHSYLPDKTVEIVFTFSFTPTTIKIEVDDFGERGRQYNFDESGKYASIEELRRVGASKRGGMGVFLVRRVMNEVSYTVTPGQSNRITMIKHIVA